MKKNYLLSAWMLLAVGTWLLTSCADNDDNSVEPVNPDQPQFVDNGKWTIDDSYMDLSVNPGDNFFMYCNGNWWKNAQFDEGGYITSFLRTTVGQSLKSKADALDYPNLQTINDHSARIDNTKEPATALLQKGVALLEGSKTLEEAWQNTGKLMAAGYATPFKLLSFSIHGQMAVFLTLGGGTDFFTIDEEGDEETPDLARLLREHPASVLQHLTPICGKSNTRGISNEWPLYQALCEGLGIDLANVYMYDDYAEIANSDATPELVEQIMGGCEFFQDMDLEQYIEECKKTLMSDGVLLSSEDMAEYNSLLPADDQVTIEGAVNTIRDNYMKYEDSYHFAKANVTDELRQQGVKVTEELLDAFKKRVAENDWMSDASKQNVIGKLDKMTINIGYPDTWIEEGLADLSNSQSLLEDLLLLRQAKFRLQAKMAGMKTSEASFHALIIEQGPLTVLNAFYHPNYNAINIFPVWLMKPAYDPEQSDAINYCYYAVLAHEITHGFDSDGANYDKNGDIGSVWASEADQQEFQRRTQLLAEWFSTLEVIPDELPGLHNDGEFTLTENISDLGGFELAYRAYTDKLKAQGVEGDALKQQQTKFYRAYGNLWRSKYTADYAKAATTGEGALSAVKSKDIHSLEKERVNGVVPNTDAWYDLFGVQPGDKLYLAPKNRIHIW